mmetsp:Transcript_16373/g.37896  ORF Transcript_16373/g.37896 Transcript_16373/m.37896 type:complete len:168 (-) Transcript_16373:276-779(-)
MANNLRYKDSGSWNGNGNGNERRSKSWVSLMSGAEQNISMSCQQLENTFKTIDHDSKQSDDRSNIPNPIKLVRRLTALEMALGQLKQDCEAIFSKRIGVVQFVVADQNEILEHTEKVLPLVKTESSSSCESENPQDKDWNDLRFEMNMQLKLLCLDASRYKSKQQRE